MLGQIGLVQAVLAPKVLRQTRSMLQKPFSTLRSSFRNGAGYWDGFLRKPSVDRHDYCSLNYLSAASLHVRNAVARSISKDKNRAEFFSSHSAYTYPILPETLRILSADVFRCDLILEQF